MSGAPQKIGETMRQEKKYSCTMEKAHGQLEKREYYQTENLRSTLRLAQDEAPQQIGT